VLKDTTESKNDMKRSELEWHQAVAGNTYSLYEMATDRNS